MITLQKDTANIIYPTVTEKNTLGTPRYIMELLNNDTLVTKAFRLGTNISMNTARMDKFIITEVPLISENLELGLVNLEVASYDYKIYTSESTGGTSTIGLSVVESGLLQVTTTATTQTTIFNDKPNIIDFK